MDLFKSFQERAQLAVAAATQLASKAGESALAALDVVAADARGIAGDTQAAVQQVTKKSTSRTIDPADLASARITEELLDHVRALTYASFRENEDAAAAESPCQVLEPWQLRHATLVLKLCRELEDLRFVLSPKRMTEARFWQIYFFLAKPYIDAADRAAAHRSSSPSAGSPKVPSGPYKPSTSWSNIDSCRDGWESDEWENHASNDARSKAAATPDDLDEYLKDIMDQPSGTKDASAGDGDGQAADDLDKYLDELADVESTGDLVEDAVEAERNGDLVDNDQDLAKYLDGLDVSEDAVAPQPDKE